MWIIKKYGKALVLFLSLCLTFVAFSVCVSAEGTQMPDGYRDFLDSLPSDTSDVLPEGIYSEDAGEVADAVKVMSGIEYLLSAVISCFGAGLSRILPHALTLLGVLLVGAVGSTLSAHLSGGAAGAFDICSRLVVFASVGGVAVSVLMDVKEYFTQLCAGITAFIPLSSTLYAMGGNIGAASSSGAGLLCALGVTELLSGVVVVPMFCFCIALSFIGCISAEVGVGSLGASVKRIFLTALGFITAVLSLSLSSQTLISSKADNLAMKGARVFLGSIPVTGGTVSSGLGTLVSGIELIRGAVGVGGIIIILILLLPVIVELWLIRGIYSTLGTVAGAFGMSQEGKLLSEVSELYGILEGVCLMCSLTFFVSMAVLCRSAAAIGG